MAHTSSPADIGVLSGQYVFGSVDVMPIKAAELDEADHDIQTIRRIAIEAAALLYSYRFEGELKSSLEAADSGNGLIRPSRPRLHRKQASSSPATLKLELLQPPKSQFDFLLTPPLWIGPHVSRPGTPTTPPSVIPPPACASPG